MSISQAAAPLLPAAPCCAGSHPGPPLPRAAAVRLAQQLKVAADPVRLRILSLVLAHGQAWVRDINNDVNAVFHLPTSIVAQHLQALRQAGLLDARPHGSQLFYRATHDGQDLLSRLPHTLARV
ncbi:ArsR/SmtB family transcription factor [Nonomuraea sp. GTA35]|uniref:ArsR/SmtB family transcription factor n=1 Tax=Nonomuraea sp. GTA35 TaxID=1676746 RepID=UPI0035BF1E3A